MSRRAKVLLTLLLLFLLSITAVYLAIAWHPEKPLRFRYLTSQKAGPPDTHPRDVTLLVENTSSATIHLLMVWVMEVDDSGVEKGMGAIFAKTSTNDLRIPPHATVTFPGEWVYSPDYKDSSVRIPFERTQIRYIWYSRPKFIIAQAVEEVRKRLPKPRHNSKPPLALGNDLTPLQLSASIDPAPPSQQRQQQHPPSLAP